MWHIVLIGYVFVTLMFSLAQPGLARKLIYFVFFTVLPTAFMLWSAYIRLRNRLLDGVEVPGALGQAQVVGSVTSSERAKSLRSLTCPIVLRSALFAPPATF